MTGQVCSTRRYGGPPMPEGAHRAIHAGVVVAALAGPPIRANRPEAENPTRFHNSRVAAAVATFVIFALPQVAAATPTLPVRTLNGPTPLALPVAIFEPDDRRLVYDRYRALRDRIGLLVHAGSQSVCTAFCVAPDVVATAGHCVTGTINEPADEPNELHFRRDTAKGAELSIKGANDEIVSHHILTGAPRLNTRPPINATSDWALLRLSKAACPAGGLRLSSRSAAEIAADANAGRIYHIAYHRDLAHWKLAVSRPCSLAPRSKAGEPEQLSRDFERAEDLLLHTCDTEAGSSGSPLLVDGEHGPEVVGINVGTYVRSRIITHDGQIVQRLDSEVISNTALRAAPLIAPLQAFSSGELLTRASEIEQLQAHLIAQGLHAGPRDGRYGPLTRSAIETYEERVGLPTTGLPTRSLLNRLGTTAAVRAER